MFLGLENEWGTQAVTAVGRGLAKAGDSSFSPRPAVAKEQLAELVTAEWQRGDFAILALINWALQLGIPSECLPLTRQRAGGDTMSDERRDSKAAQYFLTESL